MSSGWRFRPGSQGIACCGSAVYAVDALDAFLARKDIDWPTVRATPRNKRTPLYYLAEPELVMATLAGLGQRKGRR